MIGSATLVALALSTLHSAYAVPFSLSIGPITIGQSSSDSAQGVTALAPNTFRANFLRAAQFTRIVYCSSQSVASWKCGAPCQSMGGGVKVLQTGGEHIPRLRPVAEQMIMTVYIAHDTTTGSIVVTHQGTEKTSILSILNDVQIVQVPLNSRRFQGANGDIRVHDGFQKTFERTADTILAGVKSALAKTGAKKVLITGHSLGGVVGILDAMMLTQALGPSIKVTSQVFALPRMGNKAFANYVDAKLGSTMTRVSNQNDPVPLLPPKLLGYQQVSREVHIRSVSNGEPTNVVTCTGQENSVSVFIHLPLFSCAYVARTLALIILSLGMLRG
ncbi:hypothetical protein H0H81_003923 [Sphagnurus paluster]|uniref:Fungal lipase-type domain-containing protein n=1 Tax=Sphagnurus paluster TaxID=117069 RepID=A0A9P7KML9_9AGAR|nr:hypothetical protein H0H81_003923 [Sphagnurus paluster]